MEACLAVWADYGEEECDFLVIAKFRRHYDFENALIWGRHFDARDTHGVDYKTRHP